MIGTPERGYRPGLDGIRALAVAAVLAFHLDRLPGGNLGVDAFFVVSGWLITWKLLSDIERDSRVDARKFWASRLRRLMPASMAVLVALAAPRRDRRAVAAPRHRLGSGGSVELGHDLGRR